MKKYHRLAALLGLLAVAVFAACRQDSTAPTPDFDGGAHTNGGGHSLPHAQPCHDTAPATESQGQGGYLGQCVAIN
jgi:hypothetical protein